MSQHLNQPQPVILIIDDDLAQQEILGEHLLLSGFQPLHALSCESAFALLRSHLVSLILLDVNMPKVDGFQTMERLQADDKTKKIPVLFLTSMDRQYLKIKGLELGADDYITKPYNSAELIARIKAILRRTVGPKWQPGQIQGDIQAIGLSELLQNIAQSGRTSKIVMPDMEGEIVAADGNLLLIRQGEFSGLEALLRLLLAEKGHFSVQYDHVPEESVTPVQSVFAALLTAANQVDQLKIAAETTGQANPLLKISPQGCEIAEIDALIPRFPLSLFDLVAMLPGGIEDNMNQVLQAIIEDKIRCLPPATL